MKKLFKENLKPLIVLLSVVLVLLIVLGISKYTDFKLKTSASLEYTLTDADRQIGQIGNIKESTVVLRQTGLGPWDSDNSPGNDMNEENDIVRSFDQITWTIENTTQLKNEQDGVSYSGGVLAVKASISQEEAKYAKWDVNSMNWALNPKVSSDGTTFTAYYKMPTDSVTIPGKQTLIYVLQVLGAPNGLEITPKFTTSLYGNQESETYEYTDSKIKVSAAPSYNITIKKNDYLSYRGHFDFSQKDEVSNPTASSIYGTMLGYGIGLQLYNPETTKKLKGIEIPTGDITFDITLSEQLGGEDVTNRPGYIPTLWEYFENVLTDVGKNGRRMFWNGVQFTRYARDTVPYNAFGTTATTANCYNGGNWNIVQDTVQKNKYHVTVKDYEFDLYNHIFPIKNPNDSATYVRYTENIGFFSTGYIQAIMQYSTETEVSISAYMKVELSNLKATSISGATTTIDKEDNDNHVNSLVPLEPPGTYYKYQYFVDTSIPATQVIWYGSSYLLATSPSGGDAVASIGSDIYLASNFDISSLNQDKIKSLNLLQKFDDEALEPVEGLDSTSAYYYIRDNTANLAQIGDLKVLYAGKTNKTGWDSDDEMNDAKEEDLVYFDSIASLKNAGYVCVAILYEERNAIIYPGRAVSYAVKVKVKDTAQIGKVYQTTNTVKGWKDNISGSHLNSNDSYPTPTIYMYNPQKYVKSIIDSNGQVEMGTHAPTFYYGNSLYIASAKLKVQKNIVDKENGKEKINYNLDKNETVATYKISPILENDRLKTPLKVNVRIEETLPKGLTYIPNSSNYQEPEITNNQDGTTTLVWHKPNSIINQEIEPITYKAHISEESSNGTQYETITEVKEEVSSGESYKIGNVKTKERQANISIQVINLASYNLHKETETPVIEVNDRGNYIVKSVNKTDDDLTTFRMLDILPYVGDARGTSYSGNYVVESIKLKLINISTLEEVSNSGIKLYTSSDINVRNSVNVKDNNFATTNEWQEITPNTTINRALTGFALKGTLPAKTRVEVEFVIKTNGNKPLDIYNNSATVQTNVDTEEMVSPIIKIEVVKRSLDGTVWLDENLNGLMDSNESKLSGVKVTLLTGNGAKAKDINGQDVEPIITDNSGYYKFENLAKSEYKVKIEYPTIYEVTTPKVGEDKKINSKIETQSETGILKTLNTLAQGDLQERYVNAGLVYKQVDVIVNHIDKQTGELLGKVTDTGRINQRYTGKSKNFEEYILVEKPENETIVLKDGENVLNYYYSKVSGGVIEKHIDINTDEILANEVHEGKVGDPYDIKSREFENYELVLDKLPNNSKGKMTEEEIEVKYYYVKKTRVIVKYLDKETNEDLVDPETIDGHENDLYNTEPKDIKDYQLVEIPDNKEGKMTEEEITVIYYYQKIKKSSSPQTGDSTHIVMWITLLTISILTVVFTINYIKKGNK